MKGKTFRDKSTGRLIKVLKRHRVAKYWVTTSIKGKKTHCIHEGTLSKFYEEVDGERNYR
jgi:hypothetical protein